MAMRAFLVVSLFPQCIDRVRVELGTLTRSCANVKTVCQSVIHTNTHTNLHTCTLTHVQTCWARFPICPLVHSDHSFFTLCNCLGLSIRFQCSSQKSGTDTRVLQITGEGRGILYKAH